MANPTLNVKDYVTIGMVSAIGAALFVAVGMVMGMTPIGWLFYHGVLAVPLGILYMLLYTRVPKPGVVFLGSVVYVLLMLMNNWHSPLIMLVVSAVNEGIWRVRARKTFAGMATAFTIMMAGWAFASFAPLLLLKAAYLERYAERAAYIERAYNALAGPLGLCALLAAVAGGIAGAFLGRALLKRHFERAGIV